MFYGQLYTIILIYSIFFFIKWDHYFNLNKYRAMLVNICQKLLGTQINYMIDVLLQTNNFFFFFWVNGQ